MSRVHLAFVPALVSLLGAPAFAFGTQDHHGVMTEEISLSLGYDRVGAQWLRRGNERTDEGDLFNLEPAHFDSETFAKGAKRLRDLLEAAMNHLKRGDRARALDAMGSSLHSVQDFFSHSNYVDLSPAPPLDIFNLAQPSPSLSCAPVQAGESRGGVSTGLTSGHFPDHTKPANKCSHKELNKDRAETTIPASRHHAALARAKVETRQYFARIEQEIRKRFPNPDQTIAFLKQGDGKSLFAVTGSPVEAPWKGDLCSGFVLRIYGKMALVRFDSGWGNNPRNKNPPIKDPPQAGDLVWVDVNQTRPLVQPGAAPRGASTFSTGQRVAAPFSNRDRRYAGSVDATYGGLVHVKYDDGDQAWVTASRAFAIPTYDTCVGAKSKEACDQELGLTRAPGDTENHPKSAAPPPGAAGGAPAKPPIAGATPPPATKKRTGRQILVELDAGSEDHKKCLAEIEESVPNAKAKAAIDECNYKFLTAPYANCLKSVFTSNNPEWTLKSICGNVKPKLKPR